jgi:Flp pilus assembly protein TadG
MLRHFKTDERGLAAVEFALIVPIMVLLYCGLAEFTMAMMAERRAAHAASVVADLVAQSGQITGTQVTDIFAVANAIMDPFSAGTLKLRITSVVADNNATPKVVWSQDNQHGLGALSGGTTVAGFPPNLLTAGDSVIQADVQYSFTSPLRIALPNPLAFSDTFYLKPRASSSVTLLPG